MPDVPPPTLLGLRYDGGSSYRRGPADAPAPIRDALDSAAANDWSETGIDVGEHLRDAGDISVPPDDDPRPPIADAVAEVLDDGRRPLSLGGDHSVTHPILRAVRPHHPQLTVLQIDAHPDLHDRFDGTRHSHACPFARIMEEDLADRLVQVGLRTLNPPQRRQADRFGVEMITMQNWTEGRRPALSGPTYVSIDVDALDPAFAPGVSHPEPGGLSIRDVLDLLHDVDGPLVGGDVVEYNPIRDVDGQTATACAKLVRELAGQMVRTPAEPRTETS